MSGPISLRAGERPITRRQFDVLRIIERSVAERGFPPTVREILIALGLSPQSKQAVTDHILHLEAKKLLARHPVIARGLTLTAEARELLAARAEQPMGATK